MQFAGDVREITVQVELDGWLTGGAQEILAMKSRFGDGRVNRFGRVVGAEMTISEPRSGRGKMSERRHDNGRIGTDDAVCDRDQMQFAELGADARVGSGLELVERVPGGRIRNPLEQMNRREPD